MFLKRLICSTDLKITLQGVNQKKILQGRKTKLSYITGDINIYLP
jgi:hypothetical protein